MALSDSSLSDDGAPSDLVLEQALRDAVHRIYQRKDLHNLTVKRIRQSVEEDLKLQEDFFKQDSVWKEKSKTIIQSEVVRSEPSLVTKLPLNCTLLTKYGG